MVVIDVVVCSFCESFSRLGRIEQEMEFGCEEFTTCLFKMQMMDPCVKEADKKFT